MPPRRAAVSVVVFRDDTVLLVRRGREPARGLWAPVGGRIEADETAEAAALREVREETGVTVRLLGLCDRREVPSTAEDGTAMTWDIAVFAAVWVDGEPVAGDDAAEAAFVAPADLSSLPFVRGGLDAVAAARRLFDGSRSRDGLRQP